MKRIKNDKLLNEVKVVDKILAEVSGFSFLDALTALSWGIWNSLAALLTICKLKINPWIIWSSMIFLGAVSNVIIVKIAFSKKGYKLFEDKIINNTWFAVIFAIIIQVFLLGGILKVYHPMYTISFASIWVGTGIFITGVAGRIFLYKIGGFIYFISSVLEVIFVKYSYHIYLVNTLIVLIGFTLVSYFLQKDSYDRT